MTPPSRDLDERVFLVRMRVERVRGGIVWRGSVYDVGADARRYVASPHEVADVIASRLVVAADDRADP